MYQWRRLTPEQRAAVLCERKLQRRPWHSPPHVASDTEFYHLTAACYEHQPVIGASLERMAAFETELVTTLGQTCLCSFAWVVLPNHYHALVQTKEVKAVLGALGRLHGRTSYRWNGEDQRRGRKVWFNAVETAMKSEGHFWATLNYVLHNPVRHGYVERWQEWPYSNAEEYLESTGRGEAERIWREYPILEMGTDWDPPGM